MIEEKLLYINQVYVSIEDWSFTIDGRFMINDVEGAKELARLLLEWAAPKEGQNK